MTIDSNEASAALSDVNEMVQRVRQSRIYDIASQIMIASGVLVVGGNLINFVSPRQGAYIWITTNILNVLVAAIIALTLIGYFFVGDAFDLWMAFVDGGGLIVGGLWMRRS